MDREGNCEFLHSFRNQHKVRYLHFLLRFGVALDVDVVNLLILQDEGEGAAESLGAATDLRIKLVRLKIDANNTKTHLTAKKYRYIMNKYVYMTYLFTYLFIYLINHYNLLHGRSRSTTKDYPSY